MRSASDLINPFGKRRKRRRPAYEVEELLRYYRGEVLLSPSCQSIRSHHLPFDWSCVSDFSLGSELASTRCSHPKLSNIKKKTKVTPAVFIAPFPLF
jgi:hypothetical protein